jgi:hypothetical protein
MSQMSFEELIALGAAAQKQLIELRAAPAAAEATRINAIQAELAVKLGEIRRTYPGLSVESAFEALERERVEGRGRQPNLNFYPFMAKSKAPPPSKGRGNGDRAEQDVGSS